MRSLIYGLYFEAKAETNENSTMNSRFITQSEKNNSLVYGKKEESNLKDLIALLKKKENKIINLISELEEISKNDPEIFQELVAVRKDKNKETKLNIQKKKQKLCI